MVADAQNPVLYQKKLEMFLAHLERVRSMNPPEQYLYPILDMPVFSDMQTALMMAELAYQDK